MFAIFVSRPEPTILYWTIGSTERQTWGRFLGGLKGGARQEVWEMAQKSGYVLVEADHDEMLRFVDQAVKRLMDSDNRRVRIG